MKRYDVTAMGELLIDFIEYGVSDQGNPTFEANPGGAPCNVLSMLSGLGHRTAFIGKVGDDGFGHMLEEALAEQGIDTAGLRFDDSVHTTLALVHKLENGDRDFSFYRKPGADMCLTDEEISEELVSDAKLFHFGSLSLTDEGVRQATVKALEVARNSETMISFDPNLREPLWESLSLAKEQIAYGMGKCDIMKISDNEIVWFTGMEDYEEGVGFILEHYPNIRLLLLSLGKDGSMGFYKSKDGLVSVKVPAYINNNTVETTGAGDTFMGSMLHFVIQYGLDNLNEERIREALSFANAAASIITTRKGALRVMPKLSEVEDFLNTNQIS